MRTKAIPSVAYNAEFVTFDDISYYSTKFGEGLDKRVKLPKWLGQLINDEIGRQKTEAVADYQVKIKELLGVVD